MAYDFEYIRECRRVLEQPKTPDRAYTSTSGARLGMEIVSTFEECERLTAELEAQDPSSAWGFREWIAEGLLYPGFVMACRDAEDGRAVGFICFDTLVFIHDGIGPGGASVVSVKIEPKTVYVSETDRGHGAGAAFVEVIALQISAVLARLDAMSRDRLKDLAVRRISVGIEAECVSEEGSRFMKKAFAACERELASVSMIGPWPLDRKLADYIDHDGFDEEDDCANSLTA